MSEQTGSMGARHDQVDGGSGLSRHSGIIPWVAAAVVVAEIIMLNVSTENDISGLAYFLCGLAIGLAVVSICVSWSMIRRRRVARGILSLLFSLLIIAVALIAIMITSFLENFSLTSPPVLAQSLQAEADAAAVPIGMFLATGSSGQVKTDSWSNPNGGSVPIEISWARNAQGMMVTATPSGPIPKGEDGSPKSRQVLKNGMLAFPLNYFKQQGKESEQSTMDLFGSFVVMFDEVSSEGGGAILAWSKAHDGRLPDSSEASALLAKARKVFEFKGYDPSGASATPELKFEIDSYSYQEGSEGIFSIEYAWTCPPATVNAYFSGDTLPVSGVLAIHYSSLGYIAMNSAAMPLEVILDDVMKGMQKQATAEAAKKDGDAGKARDGASPTP